MYDLAWELTVILITVWLLQKLGKDLAVIKRVALKFDVDRCNLRKLSELEIS
jgi:hypothetical protein